MIHLNSNQIQVTQTTQNGAVTSSVTVDYMRLTNFHFINGDLECQISQGTVDGGGNFIATQPPVMVTVHPNRNFDGAFSGQVPAGFFASINNARITLENALLLTAGITQGTQVAG